MKLTLSWLKDHLDTDASLDEICRRLTMIGLEVETVDDRAAFEPFRIARVVEANPHPDADRLKVLSVDAGPEINDGKPLQIVCGAPNARTGLVGVLALPGTYVPGIDTTLSVGNIRGVTSNGMMCSERELELSDAHDGIIDLPSDAPVGARYADYADLADPVIEINLTPNHPEATGIFGIARDLAAAGIGTLRTRSVETIDAEDDCPVGVDVTSATCTGFALREVSGLVNGASPDWMQRRLRAIGLRPINALVDITNYLTFDRGRPLHVFDAAKVTGDLAVRDTKPGEDILALDGKTYALPPGTCVIADDRGVESIAGIMGGEESGCDETTTKVLIESALWKPADIARTGRALGIVTDARYRFERGIDPAFMEDGLDLATKLVVELCGGRPSRSLVARKAVIDAKTIELPFAEIERLTSLMVGEAEQIAILERLGFAVESRGDDSVTVAVPTWRPDVDGKADLVEEIARLHGVDKIVPQALPSAGAVGGRILTTAQSRDRAARRALAARGMVECVSYSFVPEAHAMAFGGGSDALKLENPISADLSDMRPSLLPGLLAAANRNAARGFGDTALFEVAGVYVSDEPDGQSRVAAGVRRGTATLVGSGRDWARAMESVSVFDAKADAIASLEAAGAPVWNLMIETSASPWYHPGRSGRIKLGPKLVLAEFGEFHPKTLNVLDVSGAFCGFECFLDRIPDAKRKATRTKPVLTLSPYQPLRRDYAFVVDEAVEALKLVRAAEGADRKLVGDVKVFDVFTGQALGEGKKSVAIEVTLNPFDRTLTDEDLDAISAKIVTQVEKATGGTLRR